MSGLIGSAGSNAGLIGSTELRYEEGTYTVREAQGGISGTATGNYTIIGKMCTASGYWTPTSDQPSETSVPHISLPFTCKSSHHYVGAMATDGWDLSGHYSVMIVYPGHNYMRWFQPADHAGWIISNDSHINQNQNLIFSITYRIDY